MRSKMEIKAKIKEIYEQDHCIEDIDIGRTDALKWVLGED